MKTSTLQRRPSGRQPQSIFPLAALLLATALAVGPVSNSSAQIPVFTNLWSIGSGTNASAGLPDDFTSAGDNHRGACINPATTNALYATRIGGTNGVASHVTVLNSTNAGEYLGQLNSSTFSGGTIGIMHVKASDDGSIYACNLSGGAASSMKVYRWTSDSDFATAPTTVFTQAGPSFDYRLGDYMDVRGSGLDTEIILTGNGSGVANSTNYVILKPSDDTLATFTNISITFPTNTARPGGKGVAWDGTNHAFYVKVDGANTILRIAYTNLTTTTSNWVASSFALDQTVISGIDFEEVVPGVKLLSGVVFSGSAVTNGTAHRARIFQLTGPSTYTTVLDQYLPFPNRANANGAGMSDIKRGHAVFSEANNGLAFYAIGLVPALPPGSVAAVGGGVFVAGFPSTTLSVNPSGTSPITNQWYFGNGVTTNAIGLATTNLPNILTNNNLTTANSGIYFAIAQNALGSATSTVATITVYPSNYTAVTTPTWSLAPGSRDYLTTDNTQRGLAYDPVTGNLVLVSRAPTNGLHLINSTNGADLGDIPDTASIGGGTLPINMVGVAADGVVYACNLVLDAATANFAIYRWEGATNEAIGGIAFNGTSPVTGRLGDTMAVRGAGTVTEIICGFRTGTNIALFTTADGVNFTINVLAVTNLPPEDLADGFSGLGIAFGPGNTFWAKSTGFVLRKVEYDLAAGTARVLDDYTNVELQTSAIGVDNDNQYVAAIGVQERPQNLSFWDLSLTAEGAGIDRELFPADNSNGNGTGAVAVDPAGGRIFALDSNSGIIALKYAGKLSIQRLGGDNVVTWPVSGATLQSNSIVNGTYTDVTGATSPHTNSINPTLFFRLRN